MTTKPPKSKWKRVKFDFYRMLKVSEVKKIEKAIGKDDYRMSFKVAAYTGMRYRELQILSKHPEFFNHDRHIIILNKKYTKTKEDRKVNLTPQFSELLYYFLNGNGKLHYPSYQSWTQNIRRWATKAGIKTPTDLSAGSTRKSWESWLIESSFPISKILASQGHDMHTSMKHYYDNDVTSEERADMIKETAGWMS